MLHVVIVVMVKFYCMEIYFFLVYYDNYEFYTI